MIKAVHEKLKRWGDWARLTDGPRPSSLSVLAVAMRRRRIGMSYGKEQSEETKRQGVKIRYKVVDCPKCGYYPLRVGGKCPECERIVYAGDHNHKLRQPKDDSGRIARNIPMNSDPVAEQIDRFLAEFKEHHSSLKYHAVKQKYFYWETDEAGARRLGISKALYKSYIDDVQYWLDGRLRGEDEKKFANG
jgi:predicted Zn-ribbon and HTH transcriptional regulator